MIETLFTGVYDNNDCFLEIHPGAGGTEAQDWANMLFNMYLRYAEKKGLKSEVLDYQEGNEAGIKYLRSLQILQGDWQAFLNAESHSSIAD